jgi:hypothetical protein
MTEPTRPIWNIDRLTPARCRFVAVVLILIALVAHLLYLLLDCPLELAADEAQYWNWSKAPALAYYSKGPLVAWIIAAFTSITGDHMWAVRLPALLLAAGTSACFYDLARTLFRSERLALGAVALSFTVPLFVAGSFVMTIDPPFFFCWSLATCLVARAITSGRELLWLAAGIVIGFGLLAKYAAPLWFVGVFLFLSISRPHRKWLGSRWPWLSVGVAVVFLIPPLWWNWQNGWVTFRHVGRQIGVTASEGSWFVNPPLMVLTQVGIVGPVLGVIMIVACVEAFRRWRKSPDEWQPMFLVCVGLAFFMLCLYRSLKVEIEPNWPAPAYFTLCVLAAWWIGHRVKSTATWKPVRGFVFAQIVTGLLAILFIHRSDLLYPLASRLQIKPARFEGQLSKMRGNRQFADAVSRQLASLSPDAMVIARTYQEASLLAFYARGNPKTFHIGSYLRGDEQSRRSQWDVWPDRDLTNTALEGRDAVVFGALDEAGVIRGSFESIEQVDEVVVMLNGVEVRRRPIHVGRGFKPLVRPSTDRY